jgi:hypothetical protein
MSRSTVANSEPSIGKAERRGALIRERSPRLGDVLMLPAQDDVSMGKAEAHLRRHQRAGVAPPKPSMNWAQLCHLAALQKRPDLS